MSDTMRERIARAIYDETSCKEWCRGYDDEDCCAKYVADAVLDAMREPTEAVLGAAAPATSGERVIHLVAWRLMIDAAKEGK